MSIVWFEKLGPAVTRRQEEIFEMLTKEEEEEECLMQVVSAAAGPARCDGCTDYQMEDENARPLPLHMRRHLRQPLTDRLWRKAPVVLEMFCGIHNNLSKSCEKLCLKPMNQPLQRRL